MGWQCYIVIAASQIPVRNGLPANVSPEWRITMAKNNGLLRADTETKMPQPPKRRKYRKDCLAQVIARIDFASPLPLTKKGPSAGVVTALKKDFPIPELEVKQLKEISVALDANPKQTIREIREWNYHSKSRNKKAVITADCMILEYTKYEGFNVLRSDFLKIVNALFAAFNDLQVRRLGLRYIDKILLKEPKPTVWGHYLDKNLLASFNLVDDRRTIVRVFHVLEQKFDDESRMRFQFGMPNPDYPAAVHRKEFVLDTDAFCDLLLGRDEVENFLDIFHTRCIERFEQLISDPLRKKMGMIRG